MVIQPLLGPFEHNLSQNSEIKRIIQAMLGHAYFSPPVRRPQGFPLKMGETGKALALAGHVSWM